MKISDDSLFLSPLHDFSQFPLTALVRSGADFFALYPHHLERVERSEFKIKSFLRAFTNINLDCKRCLLYQALPIVVVICRLSIVNSSSRDSQTFKFFFHLIMPVSCMLLYFQGDCYCKQISGRSMKYLPVTQFPLFSLSLYTSRHSSSSGLLLIQFILLAKDMFCLPTTNHDCYV